MTYRTLTFSLVLSLLVLCFGCSRSNPAAGAKRYTMRGEVLKLDPKVKVATIKNEKIEGWMEAMTMDFPVKDDAEWQKLAPGERITATVFVHDVDYYIGEIRVDAKAPPAP